MTSWASRPLDGVYAAIFIDAIVVKIRDGQVANRPIHAAIGVSLAGEKDVLGLPAPTTTRLGLIRSLSAVAGVTLHSAAVTSDLLPRADAIRVQLWMEGQLP